MEPETAIEVEVKLLEDGIPMMSLWWLKKNNLRLKFL